MSTVDDPPVSVDRHRPDQVEPPEFSLLARCTAELVGTFVLVLGGCGAAIFAATAQTPDKTEVGIGYLGVALAFGLTVLVMASAVGPISGGHFNPAVTIGTVVAGRSKPGVIVPYLIAQVVGASLAGLILFVIASQRAGFDPVESGFASNGYGSRSPGGFGLLAGLVAEIVLTAIFVIVILAVTGSRTLPWAPVVIGLTLTLIHLISIPITNTSVNPARSLGVAWFAGPAALGQVWLFILAPILGAVLGGVLHRVGTALTRPARSLA